MDTRLVSMVGCRAMRPLSCRDIFLSEALSGPVVLGGPDLRPFGGVMRLGAMDMVATMSASSAWCSASGSRLQEVSALMVVVPGSSQLDLKKRVKNNNHSMYPLKTRKSSYVTRKKAFFKCIYRNTAKYRTYRSAAFKPSKYEIKQ